MMGISPYKDRRDEATPSRSMLDIASLLPSQNIMKALTVFIPKAMSLSKREHLDKELIPKESTLRHLFEEKEEPSGNPHGNYQHKTHLSHHNIKTPVGNIQISSISKTY
jgi:hypothetical protein